MEFNTKQAQGLFVVLPKKAVVTKIGDPYAGTHYYYSGSGDKLDRFMYKSFNLPDGATLSAKVKYSIELDWDYAYLVYSTDNGATWQGLETNLSSDTSPHGQNLGFGITGASGDAWVDLTAALPAGNVLLGFRYWTDANTGGFGFMVDDINVTGSATDGAETDAGWTYNPAGGFRVRGGRPRPPCGRGQPAHPPYGSGGGGGRSGGGGTKAGPFLRKRAAPSSPPIVEKTRATKRKRRNPKIAPTTLKPPWRMDSISGRRLSGMSPAFWSTRSKSRPWIGPIMRPTGMDTTSCTTAPISPASRPTVAPSPAVMGIGWLACSTYAAMAPPVRTQRQQQTLPRLMMGRADSTPRRRPP
jgi:hypothetical protein